MSVQEMVTSCPRFSLARTRLQRSSLHVALTFRSVPVTSDNCSRSFNNASLGLSVFTRIKTMWCMFICLKRFKHAAYNVFVVIVDFSAGLATHPHPHTTTLYWPLTFFPPKWCRKFPSWKLCLWWSLSFLYIIVCSMFMCIHYSYLCKVMCIWWNEAAR